jgi:hypothetical protein
VTLHVTRRAAARLARNVGAEPPPAKPPRPKRVTPNEKLAIAHLMPRYRTAAGGWDYWNPYTNESAGLADSYVEARRLALKRLPQE